MLTTESSELPTLLCSSASDQISTINQLLSRTQLCSFQNLRSTNYNDTEYSLEKQVQNQKADPGLTDIQYAVSKKKKNYFPVRPLLNVFLAPYLITTPSPCSILAQKLLLRRNKGTPQKNLLNGKSQYLSKYYGLEVLRISTFSKTSLKHHDLQTVLFFIHSHGFSMPSKIHQQLTFSKILLQMVILLQLKTLNTWHIQLLLFSLVWGGFALFGVFFGVVVVVVLGFFWVKVFLN